MSERVSGREVALKRDIDEAWSTAHKILQGSDLTEDQVERVLRCATIIGLREWTLGFTRGHQAGLES